MNICVPGSGSCPFPAVLTESFEYTDAGVSSGSGGIEFLLKSCQQPQQFTACGAPEYRPVTQPEWRSGKCPNTEPIC
ncbi:MAG: hypothetical protein N2A42_09140 [Luteolibacter sp.]